MSESKNSLRPARSAAGFTIVEVLAALLLLAACLVGIVALNAERVRNNDVSAQHDRAVALANEAAKLIDSHTATKVRYETAMGQTCNTALDATKSNPERAAVNALACWQDKVEAALPNGSASVSLDAKSSPSAYVITVSWSEPGLGSASYVLRVKP